jgi:hypothetical protein
MLIVAVCSAAATLCIVAIARRPVPLSRTWAVAVLGWALALGAWAGLSDVGDRVTQRGKDICRTHGGYTAIESAVGKPHRVYCADGRRGGYTF